MDILYINIPIILIYIYFIKKIKHNMHILQLESYKNERYMKWIKNNKGKILEKREILLIIGSIILLINNKIGSIISTIIVILLILSIKEKKEKKPFVKTNRVKRLYVTATIIYIILMIAYNMINYKLFSFIINLYVILSIFDIAIINYINYPIEKLVQRKFYNQAKRKLENMPNLQVIGITGSYGKTSCKHILTTILEQKYNVLMTPASYNTTMGVVRTINEELKPIHQIFVCEMGAKYVGDIKEICDLVKPKYGMLTAIGEQHLETFKSIDNIKKTKLELVDAVTDEAFINYEDENIRKVNIEKKNIKYGLDKNTCDYYACDINITAEGSQFNVNTKNGEVINIKTKLLGEHNIINIVGAVAIAKELGLTALEIANGIRYLKPVEHRLELKKQPNGLIIIDDAYNSNTRGAKMALDVLKRFEGKQRILITPGIVELGEKTEEYNSNFGMQAAESADYVILVGEKQAKPIKKGLEAKNYPSEQLFIAKDINEAIKRMKEIADTNTVVLLENDLPDNYL